MQNPETVLDILASKSERDDWKYRRIYRNLYNKEFYMLAYSNIYSKPGNMTKGTDGKTIDGMSMERIDNIITSLKDESYQPEPARRVYIPKGDGRKRPLGIPSFDDKLVQEVVRMILEAMYEETFSNRSHGFRPNRSCHTALKQVKTVCQGARWWIEGDIKGFFDNIDHHVLVEILRRRIEDEKFIRLIWKFLKAGYMEQEEYHHTYSGTPQGGIVSPILANIYLNELDQYMEKYKEQFDNKKQRDQNPEYKYYTQKIYRRGKKLDKLGNDDPKRQEIIKEIKDLKKKRRKLPCSDPMDEEYKRIQYIRYADDFIIGVHGSKQDCKNIKQDIAQFLENELNIELSRKKTLITNAGDKARFLGYDINVQWGTQKRLDKRRDEGVVKLTMPKEVWKNDLLDKRAMKILDDGTWKPMHRPKLLQNDDLEMLSAYNAEIRGLYNFYKLAHNVDTLWNYRYMMKGSMLKTFANKYKSTMERIRKKFNIDGKFGVKYETKSGEKIRYFYDEGFATKMNPSTKESLDRKPYILIYNGRNGLIQRLKAFECEWCGEETDSCEVHHVRKLKDLEGKKKWEEIMIARNRKTMVLCPKCHNKLHAGELD